MKSVLLIGLGFFGRSIAEKLNELRHQVMAVDRDEARVNEILPLVTGARIGDCTSPSFLRSLGIDNYDVCFVTIGEDFKSSLETTLLLKRLGARKVISRAEQEIHRELLLRNGADAVICPEKQLASWAALRYTTDHILDFIALDSEYSIYDLSVPEDWQGKTVGWLDIRKKHALNLLAVRENGSSAVAVTSDTVLRKNQTLLVLGKWKDVQKCFKI